MSTNKKLLLSIAAVTCFILFGCAPNKLDYNAKPIGQPQYEVPEAVHTPTPPPSAGWVKIQEQRWELAKIRPEKLHFAQAVSFRVQANKTRYEAVQSVTRVPWAIIGCIHNMEGSLSFRTHLHNGDPLTSRTRHVPAGRPVSGSPPFQWEISAEDALRFDHLDSKNWLGIGNELQNVEGFNGLGYEKYHKNVPSPYLWSWSTIYSRGKYVADGTWSDTAVSEQCGVSPILKLLK